jgi:hypothetical protein
MTEKAIAAGEIAKTVGKAIDAGQKVGGFLAKYIGGSLEPATGILEDKLKYICWQRQIRLLERSNEFLAARGLP